MTVALTDSDQALLAGEKGPGARLAMSIVARMADVGGVATLMDITAAHIDSAIYLGEGSMAFAERLATLGGKVVVPSSLNVSGLDEHGWRDWPVPPAYAANAQRQMVAYQALGCAPIWTCAPYQTSHKPVFGQQIAWGESNAICFANSVIGARTERYPDMLDICAALTGRVPAAGLHLEENRGGQDLVRLVGIPAALMRDDAFYPVLGHLVGKFAQERIPVIEGLDASPTEDQLKALCAGTACSGAVALLHVVGVTPEAPTLEAAFRGWAPERTLTVTLDDVRAARRELTTTVGTSVELVALGSPHFSIAEFRALVPQLAGRRRHPGTEFMITTSRIMAALARADGLLDPIEAFGARISVDACILTMPMLSPTTRTVMTNSAKYAYYTPGLLGAAVAFGSTADCIESAVAGRIIRDESAWNG